ncbi:hypothetical protein H5410_045856 [Solanum commersonii]|uniref:Uncharacterized protein n=1 Tax=Solanum commersonii TaxID=4109 RepID=A0A9J5XDZ3_SOLCO|nr:hypothetical protein H5410_045856 [Solanum commersonii]
MVVTVVKWEVVITGKKAGDVEIIKNMKVQSKALKMKVISAKYEGEDMWMTKNVTIPYGVDEWHEKGNLKVIFLDIYNMVLGQQNTITELWTNQGWTSNF